MRYVVVPADVQFVDRKSGKPIHVKNPETGETRPWTYSHTDFVLDALCSSPHFGQLGARGIRLQVKLIEKFEKCVAGEVIGLETTDYELLVPALDKLPWREDFVRYLPQILPHIEAWEQAAKQDEVWMKLRQSEAEGAPPSR